MPGPGSRSIGKLVLLLNTVTESWSALARATRLTPLRSAMGVEWLWASTDRARSSANRSPAQAVARMVVKPPAVARRAHPADAFGAVEPRRSGRLPETSERRPSDYTGSPRVGKPCNDRQRLTLHEGTCKLPAFGTDQPVEGIEPPPAHPSRPGAPPKEPRDDLSVAFARRPRRADCRSGRPARAGPA